jgi:hypothetical protein
MEQQLIPGPKFQEHCPKRSRTSPRSEHPENSDKAVYRTAVLGAGFSRVLGEVLR